MSILAKTQNAVAKMTHEVEFASFYIGDLLMGVDIQQLQEINRHLDTTAIPHAPGCVKGVVNLRGEVVTVLDLKAILGLGHADITPESRNVIVNIAGEKFGLLVGRIADVVITQQDEIEPSPANVGGVEGRFFKGVYKLESELLVVLNVEEVILAEGQDQPKHGTN